MSDENNIKSENTLKDFLKKYKTLIISFSIISIVLIISIILLKEYKEKENILISQKFNSANIESKFYIRIRVKEKSGVLSKITTFLNEFNISVEKILQIPDKTENNIPILITTHMIKNSDLLNSIKKIVNLEFVNKNISIIPIE